MTVWQYALLALACQVFAAVVLSILLSTVSALSKSSVISYAVGALLLGGTFLLFTHSGLLCGTGMLLQLGGQGISTLLPLGVVTAYSGAAICLAGRRHQKGL